MAISAEDDVLGSNDTSNRDCRGRFTKTGRLSILNARHLVSQKAFLQRRKLRKREIHEEFLDAVCVPCAVADWIPGSRSEGPLVQILNVVVSDSHRIGPNGHIEGLREFCNANALLGTTKGTMEKGKNPKRVKGFRLPKLTKRHTEMSKLRTWVRSLAAEELKTNSVEEAIEQCGKIIAEFEVKKKRNAGRKPNGSPSNETSTSGENTGNAGANSVSSCPQCSFPLPGPTSKSQESNQLSHSDPISSVHVARCSFSSQDPRTENSDQGDTDLSSLPANATAREILEKEILDSARDDSLFIMLCEIFDENRETPYGLCSGQLLREYQRTKDQPTPLVKEILTYCYWRRYGAPDGAEFERIEDNLRYHMNLLKKARRALRLLSYEELRWRYSSTPHHYAGQSAI